MQAPLVGPARQDNEALKAYGYDELPTRFGDAIGAAATEEFSDYGITGSIFRGASVVENRAHRPVNVLRPGPAEATPGVTPMTEADWRQSEHYREGLSYDPGMTRELASILAERKDARDRRADVLNRYQGGIAGNSALFTARLLTQLADPVGVAAGFVPVVGQARYAALAARLGRTPARITVGAAEGVVGNALLEPVVYGAAQLDQLDYTMADSLANVAMGGLFGAGFRPIAGAVGDMLARRSPKAREAAADLAIRQAAAGVDVDVAPVLKVDYQARAAEVRSAQARAAADAAEQARAARETELNRPLSIDERRELFRQEFEAQFPVTEVETGTKRRQMVEGGAVERVTVSRRGPMDIVTFLRSKGGLKDEGGELAARDLVGARPRDIDFAKDEGFLGRLVRDAADERGMSLDDATLAAWEAGYLPSAERPRQDELLTAIDQTMRGNRRFREGEQQAVTDYMEGMRGLDEEEFYLSDQAREGVYGDVDPLADGMIDDPFDDPEFLWREEAERAGIDLEPRLDQDGRPVVDPDDPVTIAERKAAGFEAAAACLARVI